MSLRRSALILRVFHGLITLYLFACLLIVFRAAWLASFDHVTLVAVVSLCIEGFILFILNDGDCPLIHIQRKLDDDVPFFATFLPPAYAKQVIPVVGTITIIGLAALLIRLGYR